MPTMNIMPSALFFLPEVTLEEANGLGANQYSKCSSARSQHHRIHSLRVGLHVRIKLRISTCNILWSVWCNDMSGEKEICIHICVGKITQTKLNGGFYVKLLWTFNMLLRISKETITYMAPSSHNSFFLFQEYQELRILCNPIWKTLTCSNGQTQKPLREFLHALQVLRKLMPDEIKWSIPRDAHCD